MPTTPRLDQAEDDCDTFAGDGITTAFTLPANYKRMLLTSNVWRSTSPLQPMRFVPDTDEWLNRRALELLRRLGRVDMLGGQMLIWPAMAAGATAYFAYLDKNCVDAGQRRRRR